MDAPWRIELLGRLRATQGDRVVTRFRARKTGVLLAYLAYYIQRPHPREALIDLLWPEADLSPGRGNLSKELSSLRHQLEPPGVPAGALIVADRYSVQLNPAACVTDVAEFEASLQSASRAGSDGDCVCRLVEAVELYAGELLPGYYEEWILQERQHLAEQHLGAVHQLVSALEQTGGLESALEYARRAIHADPLREEAHYDLIRLYAAAGQPSAALRQYHELERLLRDELDETPSAATRALAEELRRDARTVVVARSPQRRATPTSAEVPPSPVTSPSAPRLPPQFTRLFGREEEISRVAEVLCSPGTRLVTLTGPAGSGKTRLAIATADRLTAHFGEAIAFAPLADLADAQRIPDSVVDALGLMRSPNLDPLEQAAEAFNRRPSLLVLDNLEHLMAEGALQVRALLERAPRLTCLVTSRQRLNLGGEQEFVVLPLPTPRKSDSPERLREYASVQLFLDRAQMVRASFQLTPANAAYVAALCDRLDGLPLALELAAARAQVLTPAQMLTQLQKRFDFLVSWQPDTASRHRTLRAALDWSYQLLPPDLQRFFARLGVFRGGWTLEAAELVCEETQALDHLQRLRECSLIIVEGSNGCQAGDEEMRFWMLEMLREYALERLRSEERACLEQRHATYYLALAEKAVPQLAGAAQREWLERLEREHDNFRTAPWWTEVSGEAGVDLRLGGALWRFWEMRGYSVEVQERLRKLLLLPGAEAGTAERGRVLTGAGDCALAQGEYGAARALFEESLAICRQLGDQHGIAISLKSLGFVALCEGEYAAARALFEESLVIRRQLADQVGTAEDLEGLAAVAGAQGQPERAARLFGAAEALREAIGAPLPPADRAEYRRQVNTVRSGLGGEAFAAVWAEGRAMTQEQVMAYAHQGPDHG